MTLHGARYAYYYDRMYSEDKDYIAECDYLENVFSKIAPDTVKSVLDLPCGTGQHSVELAQRGYSVTGVDISEHMLDVAKEKAARRALNINFYQASMQDYVMPHKFDAVICVYSSIAYLLENRDLDTVLSNIRAALVPGGVFVADFWNRDMFENHYERYRVKDLCVDDLRILRVSESELIKERSYLDIKIKALILKDGCLVDEIHENHKMRYFSESEMTTLLQTNGFKVHSTAPFLKTEGATTGEWILSVLASRI